ncbi:MAG: hypothetical protein ABSE92_11325 [Terriglobales bacterium]
MKSVPRAIRRVGMALFAVVIALSAFYLFLLAEEAHSARIVSQVLDRVEALRVGDSAADFERAIQGCKHEKGDSIWSCTLIAGPFRRSFPWEQMSVMPDSLKYSVIQTLNRGGLRFWRLYISANLQNEKIQAISVGLFST